MGTIWGIDERWDFFYLTVHVGVPSSMLFLVYLVIFFLGDTHVKACFFRLPCSYPQSVPKSSLFSLFYCQFDVWHITALYIFFTLVKVLIFVYFRNKKMNDFCGNYKKALNAPFVFVCHVLPLFLAARMDMLFVPGMKNILWIDGYKIWITP